MKTISVRIIKKNFPKTINSNNSESKKIELRRPAAKKIKTNIDGWINELRMKKDLERAESFNLLAEVTR